MTELNNLHEQIIIASGARDHARLLRLMSDIDKAVNNLKKYLDETPKVDVRCRNKHRLTRQETLEIVNLANFRFDLERKIRSLLSYGNLAKRYGCSHNNIYMVARFKNRKVRFTDEPD